MTILTSKYIQRLLLTAILTCVGQTVWGQAWSMKNSDTVRIDACRWATGTVYDNGGVTGDYTNSFDGWVIIEANIGRTINITLNYATESNIDYIDLWDNEVLAYRHLSGMGSMSMTCTTGRLKLHFHSDANITYNGFTLQYNVLGGAVTGGVQDLTTSNITTHGATLHWTGGSGPFHILCDNPGGNTPTTSSTSYTLTGLSPAMRHNIEIIPEGMAGNRCAAGRTEFRTLCGTSWLPLVEDFNDVTVDSMTPCWTRSVNFDDASTMPRVVKIGEGDNAQMVSCGSNNTGGHFGMVITPKIAGNPGVWHVRFKLRVSHWNTKVVVGFCDSTSDEQASYGFTAVETLSPSSNDWIELNKNYTVPSGGCRLAFRMVQSMQNGIGRMAYIDDLQITSCGVSEVRTMHADTGSFDIYWELVGSPDVTVRVKPDWKEGTEQVFEHAVSPLSVTGLGSETTYQITLYPVCNGVQQVPTTIYARTTELPIPSSMCMSLPVLNTSTYSMPSGWTMVSSDYHTMDVSAGTLSLGQDCMLITPPLESPGGKELMLKYYSAYPSSSNLIVGSMTYADDPSSFTPLFTLGFPAGESNMDSAVRLPVGMTDRYIALKGSCPPYANVQVMAWSLNRGHVKGVRCKKVKSQQVTLEWTSPTTDTVLIECYYSPTSTVHTTDTVVNASEATVTGLQPDHGYTFYVHLPGEDPCPPVDQRTVTTARRDYDQPYCEDFGDNFLPHENYGWNILQSTLNCPMKSVEYVHSEPTSLKMAAATGNYYSSIMLPEIEGIGGSVISFWAYSKSPASAVVVGYYPENDNTFHLIDTLHIAGNTGWRHYTCSIPTNASGRLALLYTLTDCDGVYYVWIDDMELGAANYGSFTFANLTDTEVDIVWQAAGTTDSITVELVHDEETIVVSGVPDTIHVSGLTPYAYYTCYVTPNDGCTTLGGGFVSLAYFSPNGSGDSLPGVLYCNSMDDLLSYELPYGWLFSDSLSSSLVSDGAGGYWLQMLSPATAGQWTTTTLPFLHYNILYLWARGVDSGVLLAVNGDTITLDTVWRPYSFLPTDTTRISVSGGVGCLLDNVGQSPCPGLTFTVDGNTVTCSTIGDHHYDYLLHFSDGNGDNRDYHVIHNPFTIEDLKPATEYQVWWQCLYMNEECLPIVTIRTEAIPLPYCINFENNNSTLPAGWTVTQREGYNDVTFDGANRMRFDAGSTQWNYLILPQLEPRDNLMLSIHGYFSGQALEVGHIANGDDTSTFVTDTIIPTNSMSRDADYTFGLHNIGLKRIALRYRGYSLSIQHLGVSLDPKLHFHIYSPSTLSIDAETDSTYHIDYRYSYNNWTSRTITANPATINFISTSNEIMVRQTEGMSDCAPEFTISRPLSTNAPYCDNVENDELFSTLTTFPQDNPRANFQYYEGRFCYLMRPWTRPVLFVFPYMSNNPIGNLLFTFECKSDQAGNAFEVGVLSDILDTSSFVPIDTIVCSNTDWNRFYLDLSRYSGDARWLAFRVKDNMANGNLYLDNFRLDHCFVPSVVNMHLERYNEVCIEGDISPEANGPFWVEYGPEGITPGQGTLQQFDSLPARLILNPATPYSIYVYCKNNRQGCSNHYTIRTHELPLAVPSCTSFDDLPIGNCPKGWSAVSGPIAVTNTTSYSGTRSLGVCGIVATPDIDIDTLSHLAVGFWVKSTSPGAYLLVGCMTSSSDPSSFHPLKTIVPRHTGSWEYHLVSFSEAPSNAHFIAFRNASGDNCNLFVDDVLLTQCAVFNMQITHLANTSITLSWQQLGSPSASIVVNDNTDHSSSLYDIATFSNHSLTIPITLHHNYQIITTSSCPDEGMPCATVYTDTINIYVPAEGFGCVDPTDLTSPQTVFFSGYYSNPYANRGAIDFGPLQGESRHTVNTDTSARDPRTQNRLRTIPQGYTSSVRLGNWNSNSATPEAEGVIYSLRVDTLDFSLLLMQYAAVLQDPMHAPEDQPRFRLELLDSTFSLIDPACAAADFIANRNLGWNLAPNNVLWKDWTSVGVDLSAYHGQQVYLRLTTYDCNEGSHFGYAYFTLECMPKNIGTQTCGNVDSNIFTAPAGFNYRWYTTANSTTLSTSQTLVVPSSQSTVYLCDLSFINNPSCNFTLSAFGGSRYPLARVDTVVTYSNCRINVQFLNRSTVSSDGINPVSTGEMAETAYWDFGNGLVSDTYNGYTSYDQPGTYTVTLVAGISGGDCKDTLVFPITVDFPSHPALLGPTNLCHGAIDTLRLANASTTDSLWQQASGFQYLLLDTSNYTLNTNLYTVSVTDPYGCTSTLSHSLIVNPSYTHIDTIRLCSPQLPFPYADTLFLPGTTVVDYHQLGQTIHGCDSSFHLHLRISPVTSFTVFDTVEASICDNELYTFFGSDYNEAGEHMVNHIDSLGYCDSLHSLFLDVRPTSAVDTFAHACDSFYWYGNLYLADTLVPKLDTNIYLCDSTTTLHLWVHPTYDLDDSIVICPYQRYLYEGVDYGGPIAFDSPHLTIFDCDSLVHVTLYASDPRFPAPPTISLDNQNWYPYDTLLLGCQPQRLYLRDTSISASRTWTLWNISDTSNADTSDQKNYIPIIDSLGGYGFQLISVSDEGCRDTVRNDTLLWVFPSPEANFIFSPNYLSIHNPEAQFYNQSTPDTCTFLWLFPQNPGGGSYDSSFLFNPGYAWEVNTDTGEYEVSLIAYQTHFVTLPSHLSDTLVCTDTATIPVRIVNTYLQFPNSVTPNGDGINDRWEVVNLLEMGEYSMNELWIYDRWGALVYHVKNISKPDDFWNPDDTHSPDGTYYFRFLAKNNFGVVKRNGVIEVTR